MRRWCRRGGCKEITEERRAAQAERDAIRQERDRLVYEQQEFRRRLAQLEKPVEAPPEPPIRCWIPEAIASSWRSVSRNACQRTPGVQLQSARKTYREEFDQAYEAAKQLVDPALRARMQQSADPGETLIGWFRELKMRHEVGTDLKRIKQEGSVTNAQERS